MNRKKRIIIAAAVALLIVITAGIFLYRKTSTEPEPTPIVTATAAPTSTPAPTPAGSIEISFFDVGEADCTLVNCNGKFMLIDGGNAGNSSFLYSYLQQHAIEYLDYIICTHAHADHVGGLAGALNYAKVGTAFAPVTEYDSRTFESFVKYLAEQGKQITVPQPGETLDLGGAAVTFLAPISSSDNPNNTSIVVRIEYGTTSFLFTGDAEREEEIEILESGRSVRSTVLKVGHHGSSTSSSLPFVTAVAAKYAVISVGEGNEYGHPDEEVLDRLSDCEIYRTDMDGTIICRSDGNTVSFEWTKHGQSMDRIPHP